MQGMDLDFCEIKKIREWKVEVGEVGKGGHLQ